MDQQLNKSQQYNPLKDEFQLGMWSYDFNEEIHLFFSILHENDLVEIRE